MNRRTAPAHNSATALIGSRHKVDHADAIRAFVEELCRFTKPIVERKFADFLYRDLGIAPTCYELVDELDMQQVGRVISIGGDGTFLRAARQIGNSERPIWGVNSGRLGFLTDVDCADAIPLISDFLAGKGHHERRSLVEAEVAGRYRAFALNELAILKQETGSIISIHTYIDDDYLASYDADGLIIATPSGSTAYSLSVNGPIVMPGCKNLILTPIAPHTLGMRPLVIPDDMHIRIVVEARSDRFIIAADGNAVPLPCGEPINIRRTNYDLIMLRMANAPFADVIRRKLMWGTTPRN